MNEFTTLESKNKNIKFNSWSFFFNSSKLFVSLNGAPYQPSHVSLLESQQNNLSNSEAYLEPYQTFKMEHFAKIVNG